MATTITNQASIVFSSNGTIGQATSNLASVTLQGPFEVTKTALDTAYRQGEQITYVVTVTNSSSAPLTNITITDDNGAFSLASGATVYPLTYVGPTNVYVNGLFSQNLTPQITQTQTVWTLPSLAANSTATLLYKMEPNQYAALVSGSSITNTIRVTNPTITEPTVATHTLPVASYSDVSILKAMTPDPVTEGAPLTYTFTMYNYGNTPATNVVLTDSFAPAPETITNVSVNGTALAATDYTYASPVLTVPSTTGQAITIPAATYTTSQSGEITVNPGILTLSATGII